MTESKSQRYAIVAKKEPDTPKQYSTDKRRCFVIMPFSKTTAVHTQDYWTSHFNDFIKPLVETDDKLTAERSSPLRGDVLRQIITDLVTAQIVVADLTDANPNVYWELGVRQSFKHCTITIAENGTKLPFDLGVKGTLFYHPKNHIKMREFEKSFSAALNDCLCNPKTPDSQVLEAISGRGTLYQIMTRDESLRKLDALVSETEMNSSVFRSIVNQCETNIKAPTSGQIISDRFRTSATETLVINRYIDATKYFYQLAERYFNRLIIWNDQLSLWENSPNSTEKWFVSDKTKSVEVLGKFAVLILEYRNQIEKTL